MVALEDYRNQSGLYDQIVSIEIFEAVGEQFWPVYFSKLKSLLASKGKAVIQSITIADESFENYRQSGDAIRTFIFPGGMLPSPSRFRAESAKAGLRVTNEFAFGKDYALTLQHWLNNFDAKLKDVRAMGFDEQFIRMWRFYLTYCLAAFQHGRTADREIRERLWQRFRARSRLYGHLEDPMSMSPELRQKFDQLVASDAVVLFMKGNRSFPQGGFSASVVSILNTLVPKYTTVNILSDAEIRTGMKRVLGLADLPAALHRGRVRRRRRHRHRDVPGRGAAEPPVRQGHRAQAERLKAAGPTGADGAPPRRPLFLRE